MVTLRPWFNDVFDENTLGTTRTYDTIPKQYPIRRLIVNFFFEFNSAGGGAANYVVGAMWPTRFIERFRLRSGAGNAIKDIPGFCAYFTTQLFNPNLAGQSEIPFGSTIPDPSTSVYLITFFIDFADNNTIRSDSTMLVPSLYEDLFFDVVFDTVPNITSAGDRNFTITNGRISTLIEQENDSTIVPSDLMREFIQENPVTATGFMNIDLPTDEYVEMLFAWPMNATVASGDPVEPSQDQTQFDNTQQVTINVSNGRLILMEGNPIVLALTPVIEYGFITNGFNYNNLIMNFNQNHDLVNVFDNRTTDLWQLRYWQNFNAANNRSVWLHYRTRSPLA